MKKRVLAVHQGFELYGSDRSFISTLKVLKHNWVDCHITVVIPKNGPIIEELNGYADELFIEDLGAITLQEGKSKPFSSFFKVLKTIKNARKRINNSDVVYINTIVPFGYLLAGFLSFKIIFVHVREIPSGILAFIFSAWFKICGFIKIYNSESTKHFFFFNSKDDSHVIWNGVNPLILDNTLIKNEEKIKLLIIGRINSWKGHLFFLKAFAQIDNVFKQSFEIKIVGDTLPGQESFKVELIQFIQKLDIGDFVTLHNFSSNPERFFTWCDILVIPSIKPEPFGRVAIEAMSLSKPVIGSDQGGLKEIVVHSETGWLFSPKCTEDLQKVLLMAYENKDILHQMGSNAYIRYSNFFTINNYGNKILNLFNKYV